MTDERSADGEDEEDIVLDNEEFGTYDMDDGGGEDGVINGDFVMSEDDNQLASSSFPPLIPIPLYSLLPVHLQKRVFEPIKEGERFGVFSFFLMKNDFLPFLKNVRNFNKCCGNLDHDTGHSLCG